MVRDQRRLAAIVSADVVEYSRLMGRDESKTLATLKAHRKRTHRSQDLRISAAGSSRPPAMACSWNFRASSTRYAARSMCSAAWPNAIPMCQSTRESNFASASTSATSSSTGMTSSAMGQFAARLQTLAEPGSICVGRAVRDQVLDKLSFTFEDLGSQVVKNIARPIEVFRIRDEPLDATAIHIGPKSARASRSPASRAGERLRAIGRRGIHSGRGRHHRMARSAIAAGVASRSAAGVLCCDHAFCRSDE